METKIVSVRALPRQGFNLFFRGGHKWPIDGRTVEVTEELHRVLRAERMVAVEEPLDPGAVEAGVLDLVDNACVDLRESRARAEVADLQAEVAGLRAAAEARKLRAEKALLEAGLPDPSELEAKNEDLRRRRAAKELEIENARLQRELDRLDAEKAEADLEAHLEAEQKAADKKAAKKAEAEAKKNEQK